MINANEGNEPNLDEPIEREENLEINEGDYEPDYSYKFKDETRNFDERVGSAIKSKEDEDYFRDLYTRADGLNSYKDKYTGLEGKYGDLESQSKSLVGGFETLQSLVDKKDMRGLAEALGLDNDSFLDYSEQLLSEEELPEKERELVEQNRKMTQRMAQLESKVSGYDSQISDQGVERQIAEVQSLIESETFSPIAKAMESKGINVFEQIVTEGRGMTASTGKEPTAKEVMALMEKKYSWVSGSEQQQQTGDGKKPTLPNVRGSASSNVGGKVKSLAELYALAESM